MEAGQRQIYCGTYIFTFFLMFHSK